MAKFIAISYFATKLCIRIVRRGFCVPARFAFPRGGVYEVEKEQKGHVEPPTRPSTLNTHTDYARVDGHGQAPLCAQNLGPWQALHCIGYAMTNDTLPSPDPAQLSRQVAIFPALKKRRQHQSNIWFFDSPKNNEILTISTDLAFMHLVILEGDTSVLRYVPGSTSLIEDAQGTHHDITSDAQVYRRDGTIEWWDFKRIQRASRASKRSDEERRGESKVEQAACAAGATYHMKTDLELANQEILFDNWLTLCAAITRCRGQFLGRESDAFSQRTSLQHAVTLENLINLPGIDVACMLSVAALALQEGIVRTNLTTQLFGRSSLLSRSGT